MYIDIDHFSRITNKEGFIVSDKFLEEFATALNIYIEEQNQEKEKIFLARLGNDEFGIIIKDQNIDNIIEFTEKLLASIKRSYKIQEKEYFLSATIGIAIFPDNAKTPDELLRLAEIALKRAKEEKGDGSFAFLTKETEKEILERVQIETMLQANMFYIQSKEKTKIIKTGFYLEYQPIYDLKTNQIVSIEALIRWKNPNLGLIPPSRFIPLAEDNRLIIPLGNFIIEEVIKQIISWQEKELNPVPIGINISYIQLQEKSFIKNLKYLIDEYKIDPSLLEFEITENAILKEEELSKKNITGIKRNEN
ncbi:MAG: hypothetical protein KatS3mg129_1651 [Leptospiraceae bacterium]|nr:MAG: hypothetical protein KatS3mg129_1651 [Leptospiraceae bacterium]